MAASDDKPGNKPPQGPRDGAARKSDSRDGVRHDSRGNAVWQWAVDTGKHAIDSTSRLLKRLEVPGLSLEDDAAPGEKSRMGKNIPTGGSGGAGGGKGGEASAEAAPAARAAKPERTSGYDPYGTRAGAKAPAARPAARPAAPVRKPAATPPARPSFWRRLFRRG
jgi:hypothetical protein